MPVVYCLCMKALKSAVLFVITLAIAAAAPMAAYADTKPIFKVSGGNVFAGGWFNTGATSCNPATNYQAPTFNPASNQYKGGILGFANGRTGSSVDFGALAMGLIQGDPSNSYGFYSGAGPAFGTLSFANISTYGTNNYWGGYLAGASQQLHCIPDYYTTKQNNPTPLNGTFNLNNLASGQYLTSGSLVDVTSGGAATIAAGTDLTVFVNGNAVISNNISYASGYDADHVPKLALVVKGNVYIEPNVTQMDGLYIAQPSSGTTGGSFWTCHDGGTTTNPDGYYIESKCGNKLTINGAVIAKEIDLVRTNGDVSGDSAEVINYNPSMVIGGQFFNPTPAQNPPIDSLISLPPIF